MFALERPSMALNDLRVSSGTSVRRFQMSISHDVAAAEARESMIASVAQCAARQTGGRFRNVVLSCHGLPGVMQLGAGFDRRHLALFEAWRGLIQKIWLPNCLTANYLTAEQQQQYERDYPGFGVTDGHAFCGEVARRTGAYVVAATETQCETPGDVPPDMMTSFEGLVVCYAPSGAISSSSRNRSMWMRRVPNGPPQCVPVPD